jgi:hypothetical protein
MKRLRIWASITLTLAILAFILLVFMILALMDIAHGEPNVVLEWGIVRFGLLVLFVLVVASAVCTGLVLKYFHDKDRGAGAKPLD